MRSRIFVIANAALAGGVAVALSAGAAQAEDHDSPQLVEMSPDDIVSARRVTYFLSTQAIGQIKVGIAEGGDLRRTQAGAMMLARWAETLPSMFPEGTNLERSRALPTVWSDREGFVSAAGAYRDAANELAARARDGDREGAQSAFMAMADTCQACHQSYREPDPER